MSRAEGIVLQTDRGQPGEGSERAWIEILEPAVNAGLHIVICADLSPQAQAVARSAARLRGAGAAIVREQPPRPCGEAAPATSGTASGGGGSVAEWMWERGVLPEATLWLSGGLDVLGRAVDRQLSLRRDGVLPRANADFAWMIRLSGRDALRERAHASLLALCDGRLGTRGEVAGDRTRGDAAVLMSGVYCGRGSETHLLAGPLWQGLPEFGEDSLRTLDLRGGLLHHHDGDGRQYAVLFSSAAHPGTAVLRCDRSAGDPGAPLRAPAGSRAQLHRGNWMRVGGAPGSIVAAAAERSRPRAYDRLASYVGVPAGAAPARLAQAPLRRATRLGFDALLAEHRRAWAARWSDCDVRITGDPELQRAVRFALFHLLAAAPTTDEAVIGARGLSGRAYRGHVFWDTDVYVLPFLAATRPDAARAVLEYRIRRLPAALQAARAVHRAGARFPWESAASGREVTPGHAKGPHGTPIPILTGPREEHIVGDIAWGAACYTDWTGDLEFARGPGADLIVATARWWASRIERDTDDSGHIRGVMGPDEYHELVDDNAFTNVLAAWNLRRAASVQALGADERRRFRELADALVDGYDPASGIYEQFSGFHALEPVVVADLVPQRPVAADLLLGRETVQRAQIVKQADALMIHYLLPDQARPGSLAANLAFYEPRTAHGSSLSPGVHAALLARAGRVEQAKRLLSLTANIDLDDIGAATAGGLHLAAMGSVWRTLSFGFAGVRPRGEVLHVDPLLAPGWQALEIRLRFRGSRVTLMIDAERVEARALPGVRMSFGGHEPVWVGDRRHSVRHTEADRA